ncbi:FkbM family methyltransferase [Myxococcota bacterium]|nr:FkbM family methyltransferase [Myxococcota bacterium]
MSLLGRTHLGRPVLLFFAALGLGPAIAALLAVVTGRMTVDLAIATVLVTGVVVLSSLAILSTLRGRLGAMDRDVRAAIDRESKALHRDVETLAIQVRAIKRTTDVLGAGERTPLVPLDDATIFSFDHRGTKVRFDITPFHHIHEQIRMHSAFYEAEMLTFIEDTFKPGLAIADVGANVGNHAVFFGLVMKAKPLVCVEASSAAVLQLERNLALNGVTGVELVTKALGRAPGRGSLWVPLSQASNAGAAKLIVGDGDVEISTLDAELLAHGTGHLDLVKLDVEGMEADVLRGALDVLGRSKPDLFVELQTERDRDAVMAVLAPLGYELGPRFNYTPTHHVFVRDASLPRRRA